ETMISTRWTLTLVILSSLILSACGDSNVAQNAANSSAPLESKVDRSNANSAANAAGSPMLAQEVSDLDGTAGERYAEINENPLLEASRAPLSTFSIDVDTASYA